MFFYELTNLQTNLQTYNKYFCLSVYLIGTVRAEPEAVQSPDPAE